MSEFFQGNRSSVHRMMGEHRRVTRLLGGARCENGSKVRVKNGRLIIPTQAGTRSRSPWRVVATDQTQHTVTIKGGRCIHGVTVTKLNDTEVTVMSGTQAEPSYAVLEYVYGTRSARIVPTATVGYPVPDATTFRCALMSFYVQSERIRILDPHQTSDILIPGWA